MRKFALPVMLLCIVVASSGCSMSTVKPVTPADFQKYTPLVESMAQSLTTQALVNKTPEVKAAVNTLAKETSAALAGQMSVTEQDLDNLITLAILKAHINVAPNSPVVSIIKSVMLVGMQFADDEINKVGGDITSKNQIIVEFVQAALSGVQKGST